MVSPDTVFRNRNTKEMSQLLFYPTAKHLENRHFSSSLANILAGGCRLSFCIAMGRLWKPVFQRSSHRPSGRAQVEQYKQSFVGFSRFFSHVLAQQLAEVPIFTPAFYRYLSKRFCPFYFLVHNHPPRRSIELKYTSNGVVVLPLFMGCPLSRNVSDRTHLVS